MLFTNLLTHQWKQKMRSPYFTTGIIQKVIMGLFGLYMLLNFLVLGYFFDQILDELFPTTALMEAFNGLIILYVIFDIFMRFFLQEFPLLSIRPYLTLPVKKSKLIHFLLLSSIPSFFNILPLFIILPFFIKIVMTTYSLAASMAWLVSVLCLILMTNFGSFYLKKAFNIKPLVVYLSLALIGGVFYLDQSMGFGFGAALHRMLESITHQPVLVLIPIGMTILFYGLVYRYFRSKMYLDDFGDRTEQALAATSNFNLFSRFGKTGELMNLEMKLIWRNKRSRTYLYLSIFFLAYPLLLLTGENGMAFKIMFGIFTTGMFSFNYAQLLLSWNSPHFDYLLTRDIKVEHLLRSKFYFLCASVVASYLITLPFSFFIEDWFLIATVCALFNMGISLFIYMALANYNSQRIDTNKGGTFNMEGFGASHFLIVVPLIAMPVIIYFIFNIFGYPTIGLMGLAVIGLIGMIFHQPVIRLLVKQFNNRKYIIAADFRKK